MNPTTKLTKVQLAEQLLRADDLVMLYAEANGKLIRKLARLRKDNRLLWIAVAVAVVGNIAADLYVYFN